MPAKQRINWSEVEKDYRTGAYTNTELAARHKCSEAAIRKRAKECGWRQDLAGRVQDVAAQKLVVAAANEQSPPTPAGRTDEQTVEQAAALIADTVTEHRTGARKSRQLVGMLYEQLQQAAEQRADIEDDIVDATADEIAAAEAEEDRAARAAAVAKRNRMLKAVSLPQHAAVARDLAMAMQRLVVIERQALGMDKDDGKAKAGDGVLFDVQF